MSTRQPDLPRVVGARVLVVEDEAIIAKDIEVSLKGLGYVICGTTDNGPEAIALAERLRPDAILMDIRLRGSMDGIAAAEQVQARVSTPVVFLTAYADEPTLRRAESTRPFGYVLKPFDDRELHVALVMALCRHHAYAELEQVVERRTEELRQALRAREDFLSIASHELRTPLAALMMHVQSLERAIRPDGTVDKLKERLRKATAAGRRLHRLIEQMLDVSRLIGKRLELHPEPLALSGLVREVVERFAAQAERTETPVRLRLEDGVSGLWDRARTEQVVSGLLSNALKYGQGRPVEIELAADGEQAVLRVADQGIGIPAPQQARIFDRFERAVAARSYGGLGLGLWIARQIVESAGGKICVQSAPGQGATFTVTLPLRPAEHRQALP